MYPYAIHGLLADLEIRDGKIGVQADNTDRPVAEQLLRLGIPPEQIVLGFRSPQRRAASEFAVA
ncbi:element excision factor XisI family protein [Armatimonas sp.]|uniref:element excision factor XisI family protein n=1 Tax=Armatimonas sp. TaxID=1872638 RepID=UPI0037529B2E